jgi:hypothetical protein
VEWGPFATASVARVRAAWIRLGTATPTQELWKKRAMSAERLSTWALLSRCVT